MWFFWLHQVLAAAHGPFVAVCGLLSSCGAQAPDCVGSVVAAHGLSSCGVQAPKHMGSVVVVHWFSSCGMWALEHVGSVVAAHRLSCPTACGILVPPPGIEPASPALEGGFLTTGPPGKSPVIS